MKKISLNARKRWILVFYAVIIIATIFSIVMINYYNNKESIESEAEQNQQALLSQMSQNIELRLNYIDRFLTSMCERNEIEAYFNASWTDEALLKTDIDAIANSDKSVESVYLFSNTSDTVVSAEGIYPAGQFFDTAWYSEIERLSKTRVVWTVPRKINNPVSPNPDASVISVIRTYPLITTPDKVKGYIVINFNTNMLNQIVTEARLESDAAFLILNNDNDVLMRSTAYFTYYFTYDEEKILEHMETEKNQSFSVETLNKDFFVKYITFREADWKIVSVTSYSALSEKVKSFRNTNLFIAFAVTIFMIVTLILTNNWMNAPVDKFMGMIVRNIEKDENHQIRNLEELGNMFLYMVTQQKELQQRLDGNIPFIKYQMASDIITKRRMSYNDVSAQLSLIKVKLWSKHYIVMLSDLDNKDIIDLSGKGAELDVYISSLYNKAEELVNQENRGFSTQIQDKICLTVMSFENDDPQGNSIKALEIAELLSNFMRDYYGVSITTAIGDYYTEFSEISRSYEDAVRLMKYKSIIGTNSVITTEDVQITTAADSRSVAVIEKLTRAFESGNEEKTQALLDEIFYVLKDEKQPSDVIIRTAMQLVRGCMEHYSSEGFEICSEHYRNIDISLNQLETADEIKNFIRHLIDEMMTDLADRKMVKTSDDMVIKIVDYVNNSYAEYNMSLNLLADKFGLSVPYLSKIFKGCTQKTFTEYLIEIRIKRAAELLINSNKKVSEIANEVGYPNPSSFIRIFKKYYYMTPVDYRNRHRFNE